MKKMLKMFEMKIVHMLFTFGVFQRIKAQKVNFNSIILT